MKEVNRPALKGEKIKVVRTDCSWGDYDVGDTFIIKESQRENVKGVYITNSDGYSNFLYDHEYVVLEPFVNFKFNIGDKVMVTNYGKQYSCYPEWFTKFAPDYLPNYDHGNIKNGYIATVVARNIHGMFEKDLLYALEYGDQVALVNEEGFELVEEIEPKVGMYAKVIKYVSYGDYKKGEIVKIARIDEYDSGNVIFVENDYFRDGIYLSEVELLPDYVPMRVWTDAEIMEAKAISFDILNKFNQRWGYHTNFTYSSDSGVTIAFQTSTDGSYKSSCSHNQINDTPNEYIGIMVALAKLTNYKLPKWIEEK